MFQAGEGAGKSGSFFFFSHDRKFLIKTMRKKELKVMLKILPDYIRHFKKNPNSLLVKIFGVFTLKKSGMSPVYIMLMENTMRFKDPKQLNYVFDLKGSMVDRKVSGMTKHTTTLKDINFLMASESTNGLTMLTKRN